MALEFNSQLSRMVCLFGRIEISPKKVVLLILVILVGVVRARFDLVWFSCCCSSLEKVNLNLRALKVDQNFLNLAELLRASPL